MSDKPYNLEDNWKKAVKDSGDFLSQNPCWKVAGFVLVDTDTANMRIFADGKERMLITPERNELMSPTQPCFQTNIEKLREQMKPFIERDKAE